jgi:hypothetical protein
LVGAGFGEISRTAATSRQIQFSLKSLALIGNASGQDAEGEEIAPRHFR